MRYTQPGHQKVSLVFAVLLICSMAGLSLTSCGGTDHSGIDDTSGSVSGVTLNRTTLTVSRYEEAVLTATIQPSSATNKNVTWSSGDVDIVAVDARGKITAFALGTTIITVTTKNGGKTAKCTVTVKEQMVQIPGGTFTMGSPITELGRASDETQYSVTLTDFYMGKYQVTQAQYQIITGTNPSNFLYNTATGELQGNRPVERVTWYDAIVFCNKLSIKEGLSPAYRIGDSTDPDDWGTVPINNNSTWNAVQIDAGSAGYRLPTEAQWEYACRAGTTTAYNTGTAISDSTGWYNDNSRRRTHAVGKKPPNAWGLYDMHGNVWEWCWDWYGSYPTDAQTDPIGAVSGTDRVMRGGSWIDGGGYARSACRGDDSHLLPSVGRYYLGFRVVRP